MSDETTKSPNEEEAIGKAYDLARQDSEAGDTGSLLGTVVTVPTTER